MKILWKFEHLLQKSKFSIFHNIFKYMIFQGHQTALLRSKGLKELLIPSVTMTHPDPLSSTSAILAFDVNVPLEGKGFSISIYCSPCNIWKNKKRKYDFCVAPLHVYQITESCLTLQIQPFMSDINFARK